MELGDLEKKLMASVTTEKSNFKNSTLSEKIAAANERTDEIERIKHADKDPVIDSMGRAYGTGGRKSAKARVWIKPGSGKLIVNGKDVSEYFKRSILVMIAKQPFEITKTVNHFDVYATVKGSGLSGQAGALRHGISNALSNYNPSQNHNPLREAGFITRDSRVVERKKYGQAKARKRFQFSKR